MSKKYCNEYYSKNGEPVTCSELDGQCQDCQNYDNIMEKEIEPVTFEVINTKSLPLVRCNDSIINMNNVSLVDLRGSTIKFKEAVNYEEKVLLEVVFSNEVEARITFEKIMGGKSGSPTSKELKDNKTRHTAIQQEQIEYFD